GHLRPVARLRERPQRVADVLLAQEQIQVLGIAPEASVGLRRTRAPDHGVEPPLLQDPQGLAVGIALLALFGAEPLRRHVHTAKVGTGAGEGKPTPRRSYSKRSAKPDFVRQRLAHRLRGAAALDHPEPPSRRSPSCFL